MFHKFMYLDKYLCILPPSQKKILGGGTTPVHFGRGGGGVEGGLTRPRYACNVDSNNTKYGFLKYFWWGINPLHPPL